MSWFKDLLGSVTGHSGDARRERNMRALAPLGDADANSEHIAKRKAMRHESTRLVHVALRRMKENREKLMGQLELYLDDWTFHNGPIDTQERFQDAMRDCVDRITQRRQAAVRLAEEPEQDVGGMQDFPF